MTKQKTTYTTALLGAGHAPFLAPHLHSIHIAAPNAPVIVLHDGSAEREIDLLRRAFPMVTFRKTREHLTGDRHARIARKLRHWAELCRITDAGPIALLDVDTIMLLRLDDVFDGSFDIGFTHRKQTDPGFPINTGVMLIRDARLGACALNAIADEAEAIIADRRLYDDAIQLSGAIDQHALRRLIGMRDYDRTITAIMNGVDVRFRGFPCDLFNHTECQPLSANTRIVHYKAGWHPILLQNAPFTSNRPQRSCRELFALWRRMSALADQHIARRLACKSANMHHDAFSRIAPREFSERGILHSEMLAVCATATELGVDTIIESGRFQGQSTLLLAEWGQAHDISIVSVERLRDANALIAEDRLSRMDNVTLVYADAMRTLPDLVQRHNSGKVGVLLDGPKSGPAVQLLEDVMRASPAVRAGWIHDMRRGSPQRTALARARRRAFFTDDEAYVGSHRDLDSPCIAPQDDCSPHAWRPFKKGADSSISYGPTLAMLLPQPSRTLGTRPQ